MTGLRPGTTPRILAALLLAGAASTHAAVGPWLDHGEARVRLMSRFARAAPGAEAGLGVELTLAPGWHAYWKNPGDAGYPPKLAFASGVDGAALRYAAPARIELPGDLVAFGYADTVVYPVDGRLAATASSGTAHLAARFDYLVCAERCVPHAGDLTLDLPTGAPADDPAIAATLDPWRARIPAAADPDAASARLAPGRDGGLELTMTLTAPQLAVDAPDLFFDSDPRLAMGRPRFVATAAGPAFAVPIRPLDTSRPLPDPLELAWTATGLRTATGATALEGRLRLDLPRPQRYLPAVAAAAALLVAGASLVVNLRRRRANPLET